jgi:hypothetical protein
LFFNFQRLTGDFRLRCFAVLWGFLDRI